MSDIDSLRILSSFDRSDRIAVLLLHRAQRVTRQRLITVQYAYSNGFQQFLDRQNQEGFDIYLSMNPVARSAPGRTKKDIAMIRHLYLDCDEHGDEVLDKILHDARAPDPRFILQTSDHKWHVIWRVAGFSVELAEGIMRSLVREFGADPAATDATRVLRWPGFRNHKYRPPFSVRLVRYVGSIYGPERFAAFPPTSEVLVRSPVQRAYHSRGRRSQSERDWAWTLEQLRNGRSPENLIKELAERRSDKPSPLYYATNTIRKALERQQHSRIAH